VIISKGHTFIAIATAILERVQDRKYNLSDLKIIPYTDTALNGLEVQHTCTYVGREL